MSRTVLEASLTAIPEALRTSLITQFEEGLAAYLLGDWEKVGAKAGKFCEIAYTICEGHATGTYAAAPSKPRSMYHDCQRLEQFNKTKGRPLCIQVPRILMGLYELRSNRAISHVSELVDPNHMDAEYYLRAMKWIVGEFVRFYSALPEEETRAVVESVTARSHGSVWQQGDVRRILDPSKSAAEMTLMLAYAENRAITVTDLMKWTEYSNPSRYRRTVLRGLHANAMVHFDEEADTVQILPPGQRHVEAECLFSQGPT